MKNKMPLNEMKAKMNKLDDDSMENVIDTFFIDNDGGYEVRKHLCAEISNLETDRELEVANAMFTTIFGWSLETFIEKSQQVEAYTYIEENDFPEPVVARWLAENYTDEVLEAKRNHYTFTVYHSLSELGRANTDSECREVDEEDEAFGEFLLRNYAENDSSLRAFCVRYDGESRTYVQINV